MRRRELIQRRASLAYIVISKIVFHQSYDMNVRMRYSLSCDVCFVCAVLYGSNFHLLSDVNDFLMKKIKKKKKKKKNN